MVTTVVNFRDVKDKFDKTSQRWDGNYVYIGRQNARYGLVASPFANPFKVGVDGTRAEVIEKYRAWLYDQPELLRALWSLKDQALVCWCHPEACHGDVLAELLNFSGGMTKQKEGAGIEWTHVPGKTGYTANPIRGCAHSCRWRMPDGEIAMCYAEEIANGLAQSAYPQGFSHIQFHPEVLFSIRRRAKIKKNAPAIFIDSMSDLMGTGVKDEWVRAVIDTMEDCPTMIFFVLTKNPKRLLKFDFPKNCWVGVSAPPTFMFGKELTLDQQEKWYDTALKTLSQVKAGKRWTSIEPLSWDCSTIVGRYKDALDWAVIGAASKGKATYQPEKVVLDQVLQALDGKPIFFKGNLDEALVDAWREEFPSTVRYSWDGQRVSHREFDKQMFLKGLDTPTLPLLPAGTGNRHQMKFSLLPRRRLVLDRIVPADVMDYLGTVPSNSVNCVVTSPPYYGLRDYGVAGQIGLEDSLSGYIEQMVRIFEEVRRVLRDDGVCWLNLGDSFASSWASGRRSVIGQGGRTNRFNGISGNLKEKDLMLVPHRVAIALQDAGWFVRMDVVWCLSGGTKVYAKTQKGVMPITIKDMTRLNPATVQLWNGEKWTQVLGWSESARPENPIELTLRSGERIGCTPNHQFPTERGLLRADELQIGDIICSTRLPDRTVVDPHRLEDSVIGWLVGMYLAEGSRSGDTIQIACHASETERYDRLKEIAESYHGTANWYQYKGDTAMIHIHSKVLNAIIDTYIAGHTASDKHLSNACWQRGNDFLRSLLDGYLDGDGHYDAKNDRWRIVFTRNYHLEADLRTLCARLGYQLRLKLSTANIGEKIYPAFRGEIRFSVSDHPNNKQDTEIVSIGRSRARKFWDIGVEDEPHLFALASGVLTHNCKPNPMPESVRDRPTKAHEYVFLLSKSSRYFYDYAAVALPLKDKTLTTYGTEYKVQKDDGTRMVRATNWHDTLKVRKPAVDEAGQVIGANRKSVWKISPKPYAEAHFATFPPELPEICIKAGCPEEVCASCGTPYERVIVRDAVDAPEHQTYDGKVADLDEQDGYFRIQGNMKRYREAGGDHDNPFPTKRSLGFEPACDCDPQISRPGIVLDPFMGAGTTAMVAKRLHRHYIGCELNPEYVALAEKRIAEDIFEREQADPFKPTVYQSKWGETIVQNPLFGDFNPPSTSPPIS